MNNTAKRAFWSDRSRLTMLGALLLLLITFGFALYEHGQRVDLGKAFDRERSQATRLQGEKHALTGLLEAAGNDLSRAQENIAALATQRDEAEKKAGEAQRRLDQRVAEEMSAARWRKEAEALRAGNAQLQQEAHGLQAPIDQLNSENHALGEKNAALLAQVEQMAADQARMDNSMTQAFRGKQEKLTVLARRTRKLQVTLDLPPAIAKEATYTITGPDGKVVKGDDPALSVITTSLPGAALASGGNGAPPGAEQVKLVYVPTKKLKPGIYKVNVRTGERSIGTTYINLR